MLLLLLLILTLNTRAEERKSCLNECFHEPEESCPKYNDAEKCVKSKTCSNAFICCHLSKDISSILSKYASSSVNHNNPIFYFQIIIR